VALYRPGPLDFIPSYIRRMHGEEPVEYRHPALEPIFNETFGIPVYQEQIMRAAVDMGGYSMAASDELRKAISKKQKDKIEKHKHQFIKGSVANGIEHDTAEAIFTDWEEFARYGFNKAHATDYGVIAVQTAYLKTHYAAEYMTALLSASKNDTAKVAFYVADCRSLGIQVLPPDINSGGWDFTIEDFEEGKSSIRFGLGAIKNVGEASVNMILQARQEGGAFTSLTDFATRVDLRQVGKRSLECLVKVGALESFGSRRALLEALDQVLSVSASHFRAAQSGQLSFFGGGVEDEIVLPLVGSLDNREQLEWERELIGLYVSDHPLSAYMSALKRKVTHFSATLGEAHPKELVRVAGLVTKFRNHQTKTGNTMGFVTIEDIQGSIELVVFPKTWEKFHQLVTNDAVLMAEGKADTGAGDPKVLVDKLSEVSLEDSGDDFSLGEGGFGFGDGLSYFDDEEPVFTSVPSGLRKVGEQLPTSPPKPGEYTPQTLTHAALNASRAKAPVETIPVVPVPAPQAPVETAPPVQSPPAKSAGHRPAQPHADQTRRQTVPSVPEPPEEPPDWHLFATEPPAGAGVEMDLPSEPPARNLEPVLVMNANPAVEPAPVLKSPEPAEPLAVPRISEQLARIVPVSLDDLPLTALAAPFLISPLVQASEGQEPRMVTVVLRSIGEKVRDVRRLKNVHGKLRSFPGQDRFSFLVFEDNHQYLLEFPNDSTCICSPLLAELVKIVGEENVRVEPIRIH